MSHYEAPTPVTDEEALAVRGYLRRRYGKTLELHEVKGLLTDFLTGRATHSEPRP